MMVAARKDIIQHEPQTPIILPSEIVIDALNNLLALVVDESGKEIIPGSYAQMQIIHEQIQRLEGMIVGFNAALIDMTKQRDAAFDEMEKRLREHDRNQHREIIRDISREYNVTPAVAEYILFIIRGEFDGDHAVSNYVNSIIKEAVGETADEIQESLRIEAEPYNPEAYDDDDE